MNRFTRQALIAGAAQSLYESIAFTDEEGTIHIAPKRGCTLSKKDTLLDWDMADFEKYYRLYKKKNEGMKGRICKTISLKEFESAD